MRYILVAVIGLLGCVPLSADDPPLVRRIQFTLTGGARDLSNVIVRVPISGFHSFGFVPVSGVRNEHGSQDGQVSRPRLLASAGTDQELVLVLANIKAREVKSFQVTDDPTQGIKTHKPFEWKDTPGEHVDLIWPRTSAGDEALVRYVCAPLDESSKAKRVETYKPYHHVFALDGKTVLTKGPGGQDTHHRGLFFGFNKITYGDGKKADVWVCKGDAYQSHEAFEQTEAGSLFGRHRVRINWRGENKEVFAEEERELTVYAPHDNGMLIEFASILRPKAENVRLDGDPQHAGFHFRANNEVAEQSKAKKPETYFLRPDGKGKIGEERNWDPKTKKGPVNLPWDAMSFTVGGKRYTALYLDHPDNPKEARDSERVYGRIGSYFEYNLTKDKPLRVQYRIWIQEGEMTVNQCEAMSRAFTEPVSVVVK